MIWQEIASKCKSDLKKFKEVELIDKRNKITIWSSDIEKSKNERLSTHIILENNTKRTVQWQKWNSFSFKHLPTLFTEYFSVWPVNFCQKSSFVRFWFLQSCTLTDLILYLLEFNEFYRLCFENVHFESFSSSDMSCPDIT